MKKTIAILISTIASTQAFALDLTTESVRLVKALDGSVATCASNADVKLSAQNKSILMNATVDNETGTLSLTTVLVKCVDQAGKKSWVADDKADSISSSVLVDGKVATVDKKLSSAQLFVTTAESDLILSKGLNDLLTVGGQNLNLTIESVLTESEKKALSQGQEIQTMKQVLITTKVTTSKGNQVVDETTQTFGQYNLILNLKQNEDSSISATIVK